MAKSVSNYVSTIILLTLTIVLTNGFVVSLDRVFKNIISSVNSMDQCVNRIVVEEINSHKYILIPCSIHSALIIGNYEVLVNESGITLIKTSVDQRVVIVLNNEVWSG